MSEEEKEFKYSIELKNYLLSQGWDVLDICHDGIVKRLKEGKDPSLPLLIYSQYVLTYEKIKR